MDHRVAIVGAGYAGMAAAVTLAERGVAATVFESGPVPGGRARRVRISAGGQDRELDNGQHIFVGAYTELFRLMRAVGVSADAVLRLPLEIRYARDFAFRAASFRGRLGLAAGLLLAKGISIAERLGALRFMRELQKKNFRLEPDISVKQLLSDYAQGGRIGHYLWAPLCVSALNTPLEQASANVFLAALRDTLAGPPDASDLVLPRVDLSRLFPEPAAAFVTRHGGEVRLRSPVQNVMALKEQFRAVIVA